MNTMQQALKNKIRQDIKQRLLTIQRAFPSPNSTDHKLRCYRWKKLLSQECGLTTSEIDLITAYPEDANNRVWLKAGVARGIIGQQQLKTEVYTNAHGHIRYRTILKD